jgi:hypothetical protein
MCTTQLWWLNNYACMHDVHCTIEDCTMRFLVTNLHFVPNALGHVIYDWDCFIDGSSSEMDIYEYRLCCGFFCGTDMTLRIWGTLLVNSYLVSVSKLQETVLGYVYTLCVHLHWNWLWCKPMLFGYELIVLNWYINRHEATIIFVHVLTYLNAAVF